MAYMEGHIKGYEKCRKMLAEKVNSSAHSINNDNNVSQDAHYGRSGAEV